MSLSKVAAEERGTWDPAMRFEILYSEDGNLLYLLLLDQSPELHILIHPLKGLFDELHVSCNVGQ